VKILVTGGAGFIGSNLVDALVNRGHQVRIADDLSTGRREFISHHDPDHVSFLLGDLLDPEFASQVVDGCDAVFHLSANADVRFGWDHPAKDIEQNIIVTHNILESMRKHDCRRILFSSTGSVYGRAKVVPTPEDASFPIQTSLYGASKAAGEGLIEAYAEAGLVDATIFRFVSILGPRYTHGHVIDFVAQLLNDGSVLRVLGNGQQTKSYLHVADCVNALLNKLDARENLQIFNLGADSSCTVRESIGWIIDELSLAPKIEFGSGDQGWIGDNPLIFLDTAKMRASGWSPAWSIEESVRDTVKWLLNNRWVLANAIN
jgi:UDP-glucose 4-epimerase